MNDNNKYSGEEKLEASDVSLAQESKTARKLGNFWYHNKWTIIIVTFFVSVAVIVAVQLLTRVKYDVNVTVCGPHLLDSEKLYYASNDLNNKLDTDINGDGKKTVSIVNYSVFSESELNAINKSQKDNRGNYVKIVEQSDNLSQYKQFIQYSQTGDSYIFIVSKYAYEPLKNADPSRLVPISEIFGSDLPEGTLDDGYGIKLSETALYKDSAALQSFAEDYIICICRLTDMAGKKQRNIYEQNIEYLKDLVK